jgi:hypothetical protein
MVCDAHAASVLGGAEVVLAPPWPDEVDGSGLVLVVVEGAPADVEPTAGVVEVEPTSGAAT